MKAENEGFFVKDSGQQQFFTGQIMKYDGLTGKYGVYFPFDGKVVYIDHSVNLATAALVTNSCMHTC